jgi:hypothetical protein
MKMLDHDCHDWQLEAVHWRENHKSVVATKRRTDVRLKMAIAALQDIYNICGSNALSKDNCRAQCQTIEFIGIIAGEAFEEITS